MSSVSDIKLIRTDFFLLIKVYLQGPKGPGKKNRFAKLQGPKKYAHRKASENTKKAKQQVA